MNSTALVIKHPHTLHKYSIKEKYIKTILLRNNIYFYKNFNVLLL